MENIAECINAKRLIGLRSVVSLDEMERASMSTALGTSASLLL